MRSNDFVKLTIEYTKNALKGEHSGHDWWHAYRVWSLAKTIASYEGGDFLVIELAALLHDIADWKFHNGDFNAGPAKARKWLESIGVDEHITSDVCNIIAQVSFKGAKTEDEVQLELEGKIVQDADRLDAMGAVGIARTFAYGGVKGRALYDPDIEPIQHETMEDYINNRSPSINHFYEKLLLLKDRMNTEYAKKMACRRHAFMEDFLDEFFDEWAGEK